MPLDPWTWAMIAAGVLGTVHGGLSFLGQKDTQKTQRKSLELQAQQMGVQANIGRQESEKAEEAMQKLLEFQATEKREARQTELSREAEGRNQQTMAMLMSLLGQEMNMRGPEPTSRWPSSSLIERLQR